MFAKLIRTRRFTAVCSFALALLMVVTAAPAAAQQIDSENEKGMVIDDMWYLFADDVEFYANPDKTVLANRGDFRQGTKIGFELKDGKISVVWLR